jgi:aminopeptidase N
MLMNKSFLPALCLLITLSALADAPFDFDKAPGRLPKTVVPLDYVIALKPDLANMRFTGTESVRLRFRSAADSVMFDSLDEVLSDVRLDGKPVKSTVSDDTRQLTTVTLERAASSGLHVLSFSYTGKIATAPVGMFVQSYASPSGEQGQLLSSNMEPTDARRMFPCWDEPGFRASYQLTVTVPKTWAAVANMPVAKRIVHGDEATISFQRSPAMPSYLVELTAGDIAEISARTGGTDLNVWAVRGQEQNSATALANAQIILADYNDYFGYRYPLPKLDSIAIPGGFSGGMENWGAITYNDQLLLLTSNSSIRNRQDVFSTEAHEVAHQWNGDLVTMGWWDNLWLNESFASFMAARETALRNPGWNWWELQDGDKEEAMNADASMLSHAIEMPVADEAAATSNLDSEITYSKGQAVLRMLESYMGADTFRSGIRSYIRARAFSNATSADLWQALGHASGTDIAAVAAKWTEQAGFPLLSVTARCAPDGARVLSISQQRFLVAGADSAQPRWIVPLRVRTGGSGAVQSVLLRADEQALSAGRCDEPLSVNADAIGYYRVRYDSATLATDRRDFAQLPMADRIALLDDQWALVTADQAAVSDYLKLASAMGTAVDARAWQQIAAALDSIELDEFGKPGHDAFAAYARSLIKPVADQLGWTARADETPAVEQLRRRLLGNLGAWGDQQVIDEAHRRFDQFLKDRKSISPDDQDFILATVAAHADAATFEQLHAAAQSTQDPSERRRLYGALAVVRDPDLAAQVAKLAMSAEIAPQEALLRLRLVFVLAARHPQLAWSVYKENNTQLFAQFAANAATIQAQYVPQVFWSALPPADLDSWLRAQVPAEFYGQLDHGLERARLRLAQRERLVPAADAYLSGG